MLGLPLKFSVFLYGFGKITGPNALKTFHPSFVNWIDQQTLFKVTELSAVLRVLFQT